MKKGLTFGIGAWILSLLIAPFVAPLIFHGGDMQALGSKWSVIAIFVIALPAFIVGYRKSGKTP